MTKPGARRGGKTVYVCSACGARQPKWAGQCPDCLAWNSLQEAIDEPAPIRQGRFGGFAGEAGAAEVQRLGAVEASAEPKQATGIGELDRVLGGGLVRGSVVLIGGDPGVGKSTLLLQTLVALSASARCLYVSGEESPQQVSLRAHRLGLGGAELLLLAETCVERILAVAERERPAVMVIDSVQTIFTELLQSAPGSVAQVREGAAQLVRFAKQSGTALFLVGHVTKEGALAGPRVLEHMVDTVLYFEGELGSRFRLVRAIKNRFGAVNELGVFAMTDKGLREVSNPSAIFLSGHQQEVPGSAVLVTWEGSRPLLVEVQALVDESQLANPRRVALGLEQNRLAMLLAVLHRHAGVAMFNQDVLRQRGGRRAHHRDRRRPAAPARGALQLPRPSAAWGTRRLRRDRTRRRDPPRPQRRRPPARDRQARLPPRPGAQGQCAQGRRGGAGGDRGGAPGAGAGCARVGRLNTLRLSRPNALTGDGRMALPQRATH